MTVDVTGALYPTLCAEPAAIASILRINKEQFATLSTGEQVANPDGSGAVTAAKGEALWMAWQRAIVTFDPMRTCTRLTRLSLPQLTGQ